MPPRLQATRVAFSLLPIWQKTAIPGLSSQHRCASILSSLSDRAGAYNKKIRRGRGPASGKGKTGGRGQKGQHAHGKVPAGFEGGQTPLSITKPERGRGKHNAFKVEMSPINLDRIQSWIDQGRLDASRPITMKELQKSRCLHGVKRHGVKLLARNPLQLTSAINIVVSRASAEAIARIEALGGTVTTRFYSPTSIKRVLRGHSHPTEALASLMHRLSSKYKYRLPDATARKDIEYYRDPAHRGYLAYTVKQGESPSLFFKPPGEARDRRKQSARRDAAKASADNKLF
ncbi:ribosomal protein L18e/L15P [Phaeosphaeriaceae sp. PMI808]|nr:ribosomal protein L18e/L15P [Phaeosphaeriaceae sp. PMI808]